MRKGEDGKGQKLRYGKVGIMDLKLIHKFLVASLFTGTWFLFLSDYCFIFFSNFDQTLDQQRRGQQYSSKLQLTKQVTVQSSRTTSSYVRSSVHYAPLFVCLCFRGVIFFAL
jgi:hypothetical protein